MSDPINSSDVKYRTGLDALDRRLGGQFSSDGGIPDGSIVLVYHPPESNLGTLFSQKLLMNQLEMNPNSKAFYLHSSRPQHIIINEFKAYNWDISNYSKERRWQFFDMWHITSSHVASSSKIGQIDIRRKTYLKQAYEKILLIKKTENVRCFTVVDNLLWLKEDDFDKNASKLHEFFKELTDIIVQIGGIHFLVLPKGILEKTAENLIISVVNGIFEFSRSIVGNKNQDQLSIIKMMGTSYESEILDITPDTKEGLRIESTSKI